MNAWQSSSSIQQGENHPNYKENHVHRTTHIGGERKRGGLIIFHDVPQTTSAQDSRQLPNRQATAPIEADNRLKSNGVPMRARSESVHRVASTSSGFLSVPKGSDRNKRLTPEVEVEEDVHRMNSEANDLRERSRTQTSDIPLQDLKTLETQFPPFGRLHSLTNGRVQQLKQTAGSSRLLPLVTPPGGSRDVVLPIHERETPQIMKNKLMRGEQSRPLPSSLASSSIANNVKPSRRRSSFTMRGKRTSTQFDNTGLLSESSAWL